MLVQYIGPKDRKEDNVARSGTVWHGRGDVQEVTPEVWGKLSRHPDVWVLAGTVPQRADLLAGETVDEGPTFEDYLRHSMAGGAVDFTFRCLSGTGEGLQFYVHPAGQGGVTLNFLVQGNQLQTVLNGAERSLIADSHITHAFIASAAVTLGDITAEGVVRTLDEARVDTTSADQPKTEEQQPPAEAKQPKFALQHQDGTVLDLDAMDDAALKAFVKDNELQIDLRKVKGGDALREAIVEAVKAASADQSKA